MESDVLTESIITSSKDALRSSEIRESSENSLNSGTDVALRLKDTNYKVWITSGTKLQGNHGKSHEHSEKLPYSAAGIALQSTIPSGTLEPLGETNCKETASKTSKYSEISLDCEVAVAGQTRDTKSKGGYLGVNVPV